MKKCILVFLCILLFAALVTQIHAEEGELAFFVENADTLIETGGPLSDEQLQLRTALRGDPYAEIKQVIYEGLHSREESINVERFGFTTDDVTVFARIYKGVVNAHPEFFYVLGGFGYGYNSKDQLISILPKYDAELGDEDVMLFDAACDAVLEQMESGWSDLQKMLFLHDYLVTHCEYDKTLSRFSAYDALVRCSAVCQGYARALSYLGNRAGVDVRIVTSAELNHAWNMVFLDGEAFYIDCTWDDVAQYDGYCKHVNFLRSRDGLVATGHESDDWACGEITDVYYIWETSSSYDDAWWNDVYTAIPQIGKIGAYTYYRPENNGLTEYVYFYDFENMTEQKMKLATPQRWPVWDNNGRYWSVSYSTFASVDGVFYFTMPEQIFRLNTTGEMEPVYELTAEEKAEGYIYGIINDNGTLYYNIKTSRSDEAVIRSELLLTSVVLGDVDNNGTINTVDASMVLMFYIDAVNYPLSAEQCLAADVDGNGVVNTVDASIILQHYVGNCNVITCPVGHN